MSEEITEPTVAAPITLTLTPFVCYCLTEPGKKVKFCADPATGKCPCGLDITDPRNSGTCFRREIIHLDPPTGFVGRGHGFAACNPTLKVPGPDGVYFSGEWSAVTCPACEASEPYLKLKNQPGEMQTPKEADFAWVPPVKK